ncbi:MAG: FAD-dependent oxidoreductase [Planctomycetes bacterium]|nr:FAD-dependent oxidoreductase [Planctomycetota bacterium]
MAKRKLAPALLLILCLSAATHAQVVTVLHDFESAAGIDRFAGRLRYVYLSPSTQHKTNGAHSCEARFFTDCCSEGNSYIRSMHRYGDYPYQDWRPYREFAIDIYNPQGSEITLHISFTDRKKTADFAFALKPNDWTRAICPTAEIKMQGVRLAKVAEIQIYQKLDELHQPNRIFLDYMRLVGTDAEKIAEANKKEDATADQRKRRLPERTDLANIVPKLIDKNRKTIHIEKDAPIVYETDVVVVGGGLAGTAAAVAAAREGAKVLLIERAGCLGGMATSGLVPPALNVTITEGIERELIDRVGKLGGKTQNHNPEIIKQALYNMVHEAGVKLMLYTLATDAVVEGDTIKGVIIENKGGTQAVMGKVVIDATGDGDIAARAGAPYEIGRGRDAETQSVTLMFLLGNVDTRRMRAKDVDIRELFRDARRKKEFTSRFASGVCGGVAVSGKHGVYIVNSINVPLVDGLKATDLTYAQVQCQRDILGLLEFFRKRVPGCEEAYVVRTAAWIGVRETRRIMGEYVLTGEDVLMHKSFPDAIARGFYPVDIHVPDGTGDAVGMRPMAGYEIPYRCLVPKKIDNLLLAGRCISCDHIAHGSVRVQGTTLALGEAAGYAAALAVKEGTTPRKLDPKQVQAALRAHNALPAGAQRVRVPDNLALFSRGTKVTADSVFKSGGANYGPRGAIDGFETAGSGSRWLSAKTPPPHWLELDFGEPKTFECVRLRFWDAGDKPSPAYYVRDYAIQVEKDGQWVDIVTMKGNDKRITTHTFPPVTARRLRLYITKPCKADDIVRLREIEVHEKAVGEAK